MRENALSDITKFLVNTKTPLLKRRAKNDKNTIKTLHRTKWATTTLHQNSKMNLGMNER